jgi:predicted Rossmann fold nucleotide-binding protein DprA/Smf involved in DNA uptake
MEQENLKKLREERHQFIDQAKALIKSQSLLFKKIKDQLKEEGKTVPELARETGIPSSQVLWLIMALKKYGQISEGSKNGDYFTYQLTNN